MKNYKLINNGFNPLLIKNAKLVGKYDIPLIKNEKINQISNLSRFIPFDKRNKFSGKNGVIHFYIYDGAFKQIINNPEKYVDELKKFTAIISPDFSICYDMPILRQMYNTYMNRAIGSYYQMKGIKVIPNIRWGDSRSYDFCFDGVEKEVIYSIGSYGQLKRKENRYYFEKGLEEFFKRLNPKLVYVYGATPDIIFRNYMANTKIVSIEPYVSKIHRGKTNGCW